MWKKTLLAGAAALVLAGSSFVYAQQQGGGAGAGGASGPADRHGDAGGHGGLSAQDRAAFLDARIAALKAGLQLTPDQEKNWPAFESALRGMAKLRAERMQEHAGQQHQGAGHGQEADEHDPAARLERLKRRAERLSSAGAALKQLADTEEPLLASLTDAQKHRFAIMSRMAFAHHHGQEGWRGQEMGGHGQHWQHPGMGGGQEGQGWHGHGMMGPHGGGFAPGEHGSAGTKGDAGADRDAE